MPDSLSPEDLTEGVVFQDDTEVQWLADAMLGDEARRFTQTNLGRMMIARASMIVENVARKLIEVDPSNQSEIISLQIEAKSAQQILVSVQEAISYGEQAEKNIEANNPE